MSCQRNAGKITVPDDLRDVLLEFTISYLLEQPGDIIDYAVDFFTRLRDARQTQLIQDTQPCASPDESVDEGESYLWLVDLSALVFSLFPCHHSLSRSLPPSLVPSISPSRRFRANSEDIVQRYYILPNFPLLYEIIERKNC